MQNEAPSQHSKPGLEIPAEFRPERLSRRTEAIAWITAALTMTGWIILQLTGRSIPGVPFLIVVFTLAAMALSLGNWMDRKTVLRIEEDGVVFTNGVRHAQLLWEQIQELQVFPVRWGKKVRVIGESAHFDFRTLSEMAVYGEVQGRFGFTEGERILEHILEQAHLKEIEHSGSGYYYARE